MKDMKKIMNQFLKDYQENPEGWSYWTDKDGEFYDIYILREDKGYFLKMDSIYTQNPIGKGTKIKIDGGMEGKLPDFGFRRFSEDELENFFYALKENKESDKTKKKMNKMMQRKMSEKPSSLPSDKEEGAYLMGPFNQGYPFDRDNRDIEDANKKLKKKLRKQFRKEYPMYR